MYVNHNKLEAPSLVPFTVSLISLAAKNCLTAQAKTSSGAMIVHIIVFNLRRRARQSPEGGTFGCTDTHAQMIMVAKQFQIILNNVRFKFALVAAGCTCDGSLALSGGRGKPFELQRNKRMKYGMNMVENKCNEDATSSASFYIIHLWH